MAEPEIPLQRVRRYGRRRRRAPPTTLLPLHHGSPLSNTISCCYCDFKFSVFNQPIFQFGQKYSRCLKIWFSVGLGFSLTTLIGVTLIMLLELTKVFRLYNGIRWLSGSPNGSMLGFYSLVFKFSISIADVGYVCVSTIMSVFIHELGHALSAASEGIQIEYTAVFLAVLFPGALVAFNHELLQMIPRLATLRIYCAGIWHNAAFCAVCALTLFLLPLILYPLYVHGESLMVLDVSSESPLNGYLSPGDLITKLDGKRFRTIEELKEMADSLDKQIFQTTTNYSSNGYCVPNSVIAESKNIEIIDNKITCPNELVLFTTISCDGSSTINDSSNTGTDHPQTIEHYFCLPAKVVLGEKKCGDGWVDTVKKDGSCLCSEEESCSTPVQMPGLTWVEITYSRPYSLECHRVGNKSLSRHNYSSSGENSCSGSFVFVGDVISMANSIWLTEYQCRWSYGAAYGPALLEKLMVNTFQVSLMLALLNSLPVYYLDGESILELALCYFTSMTPTIRKTVLQSSLLAGTLISFLLILRMAF